MKNKMAGAISLIVTSCLLLSACGGAGSGSKVSEKTDSPATQVKLKIISVAQTEQPDGANEMKLAEEFMSLHPNIKIEFIGVPMNELYKKLTTLATGGDLPDAFTMTPEFMRIAHGMGMNADLNKVLGADYLKAFQPDTLKESTVNGELQLLPWHVTPQALIYRGDWFEQAGLKPPETWDQFIEVSKALTSDTNNDGKLDRWGFAMIGTRNTSGAARFIPVLRTFGAAEIRQDSNGKWVSDLNTQGAKEAFQLYADLNNKYKVVPPGVTETGFPEAATLMATEKVAMLISGPNALGAIYAKNPSLKGKLYSTPIPKKVNHAANFGVFGYSISAKSKHQAEAAEYLKFLVNKENSLRWNALSGRLPTRLDVAQDQQLNTPEMKGFTEALKYYYSVPDFSTYDQLYDIVAEGYQAMIATGATADTVAKNAEGRANKLISQEKK